MLPEGSINSWRDLKQKSLDHFFNADTFVTTARLCSEKQGEDETVSKFIKRWRALSFKCLENLSHESLMNMCKTNMHYQIRAKLVSAKPKSLGELLEAAVEATAIIKDRENEKNL
ncbi:hypothetical protein AAC387_Pa12g0534 [Persea americana]